MAEQICSAIGSQDAQEGEEIRGQRGMVWSDIFLIVNGKSMETGDRGKLDPETGCFQAYHVIC